MRVVVLGGGVVGVASAWYLRDAGHEVVLVERRPGPALETSFANAGEVSPGYSSPWAAPGVPLKTLRWLFERDAPLVIRPRLDFAMVRWLWATLRECDGERYAINKERMVRLARFSQTRLDDLRSATGISYDEGRGGTLQLFRDERDLAGVERDIPILREHGLAFETLDARGCVAREPGLARSSDRIAGGFLLPGDETGDCHAFTTRLAELARMRGVDMRFGMTAERLVVEAGRVVAVDTGRGNVRADAVVVALGAHSPALLSRAGIRIPVYPVKGYSLTVSVSDARAAPVSTVLDDRTKVAITRLGDRVRIGGMAEIGGFTYDLPPARRATLERSFTSLFPGAGDPANGRFWSGLRPMTPDGTPIVGGTSIAGLFLNTGHGTLGWTMACGSGHVIADLVGGSRPAIPFHDLGIDRYAR